MARQESNGNLLWPAPHLVGLFLLYAFVSPPLREAILSIGPVFTGLLTLVVAVGIAMGTWRLITRLRKTRRVVESQPSPALRPRAPAERFRKFAKGGTTSARLAKELRSLNPCQIEKLVILIYRKLGFKVSRPENADAEGSIDLLVDKDGQRTGIQCQSGAGWNVSAKAVSAFFGTLRNAGLSKGILIALCGYTGVAKHFAENQGIELLNGADLADLIEATGACADPEAIAILRDGSEGGPQRGREMVLNAAKGQIAEQEVWGRSIRPKRHVTLPA